MTDVELELCIAEEAIREADECVTKLRKDYHALREHANVLETLLHNNGIEYPHFYGW